MTNAEKTRTRERFSTVRVFAVVLAICAAIASAEFYSLWQSRHADAPPPIAQLVPKAPVEGPIGAVDMPSDEAIVGPQVLGSHGSRFVWMICASTRSSALRGSMSSRRSRRIFRRAIVPASNSPEISPRTLPRPAWTGGFSQSLPLRKTVARACSDERALSNRPRLRVGAMSHGARRLRFTCCRRFRASGSAARSSSTRNIYLMFRAR